MPAILAIHAPSPEVIFEFICFMIMFCLAFYAGGKIVKNGEWWYYLATTTLFVLMGASKALGWWTVLPFMGAAAGMMFSPIQHTPLEKS